MNRNFNEFTDFKSLELKVLIFCFVTGCVSARRDRRYSIMFSLKYFKPILVFSAAFRSFVGNQLFT